VAEPEALLATSSWDEAFAGRFAFVAASRRLHGLTGDRTELLGRDGSRARPAALRRIGLASRVLAGHDPCAALQVHVDLRAGEATVLHFVLGQAEGREEALRLVARYRERGAAEEAWAASAREWSAVLDAVTVSTPEPVLDVFLNRWLLYQTLSSRVWGRTAFYQSAGAFGFRDQLQDVLALLHARPAECRRHLLEAARHQFEEGDVLHWWHPPSDAGVRTRCSDDLLWLPHAAATYVAATGDAAVLGEEVAFLRAEELGPAERERYGRFEPAGTAATLHEHCLRALRRGSTRGVHGLPLMGTGDWNDGMDRVGARGRGESVWLAWFLHATLTAYARCCEARGERETAAQLRATADAYRAAAEEHGWDGAWYRRAFDDDGRVLGSAASAQCRIDSIAQSWAVISGAADPARARQAIESAWDRLAHPEDGLLLLLAPPFDRPRANAPGAAASAGESAEGEEPPDPGYVAAYPPGVRENGGQYTHAAAWLLWATADLGDGDRVVDMLCRLLPASHAATRAGALRYRVEPYAVAGDVYGLPPHRGRGGWTWYTGSAAWINRLGIERVLGIRLEGGDLVLDPCIPRAWPGFAVTLRQDGTTYRVRVENPEGVGRGVARLVVDGEERVPGPLRRERDGGAHDVVVTLGAPASDGGPRVPDGARSTGG
jgi:cyclic beta-1,2-glucan synthetase